jgi:hypothetical protein
LALRLSALTNKEAHFEAVLIALRPAHWKLEISCREVVKSVAGVLARFFQSLLTSSNQQRLGLNRFNITKATAVSLSQRGLRPGW